MLFKNQDQLIANGQTPELQNKRKDVLEMLTAAIEAVDPYSSVKRLFKDNQIVLDRRAVNLSDFDNIYVVGFGKASVGMAKAVCDSIAVAKAVIITNNPLQKTIDEIDVFVGGHPIPTMGSIQGTENIIQVAEQCKENDLLIVLISGGGSALLCKPRIDLKQMQKTTDLLLRCGADINEINTIRKHLSLVKGGQLVKYARGYVLSLVISDIVNDPLEFIASGPTVPDSTTFFDTQEILKKYELWEKVPVNVKELIEEGISGKISETPKKEDTIFKKTFNFIVANNEIACKNILEKAESLGYDARLLSVSITGEAKNKGLELVSNVQSLLEEDQKIVFIAGGETTVTVKGNGKGGRNQELVLGCVEKISGTDTVIASFATDGIDGNSDAAGAIADGYSLYRAKKKGYYPKKFLDENNSYDFFNHLNDLFLTGPTGTNVMDVQLILH